MLTDPRLPASSVRIWLAMSSRPSRTWTRVKLSSRRRIRSDAFSFEQLPNRRTPTHVMSGLAHLPPVSTFPAYGHDDHRRLVPAVRFALVTENVAQGSVQVAFAAMDRAQIVVGYGATHGSALPLPRISSPSSMSASRALRYRALVQPSCVFRVRLPIVLPSRGT